MAAQPRRSCTAAGREMCSPSQFRDVLIDLDLDSKRLFRPNSLLEVFVREATGIASGPISVRETITTVRDHIRAHDLVSLEDSRLINCDKTLMTALRVKCDQVPKADIRAIIGRQLDPRGAPKVSFKMAGVVVRTARTPESVTEVVSACTRIFTHVSCAYSGCEQRLVLAYVRNQVIGERLLHLLIPHVLERKKELLVGLYLLRRSRDAQFVDAVCSPRADQPASQ